MYDEQEQVRMYLQWRPDDFEVVPENGVYQIQSEYLSEITAREDLITYSNTPSLYTPMVKCSDILSDKSLGGLV